MDEFAEESTDDFAEGSTDDFAEEFIDNAPVIMFEDEELEEAINAEEDEAMIAELHKKLESLGYIVTDDMNYDSFKFLENRIPATLEEEDREIVQVIIQAQEERLVTTHEMAKTGYATMFEKQHDDFMSQIANVSGGYSSLPADICDKVKKWTMQGIISDPNVTADELYCSFIESTHFKKYDVVRYGVHVQRYIETLHPLLRELEKKHQETYVKQTSGRNKLANYMLKSETDSTERLKRASKHAYLRQIIDVGGGKYETACPCCGNRFELNSSVCQIVSYALESRMQHDVYVGCNVCTQCGAALVLTLEECARIMHSYLKECKKSMDSFLEGLKKASTGASLIYTGITVDFAHQLFDELFISEIKDNHTSIHETKEVLQSLVSDSEMKDATEKFYFKLNGLHRERKVIHSVESSVVNASVDTIYSDELVLAEKKATANKVNYDWTPHDVAVFITQCLSRDYYTEKNKALFSLVFALKSNPFLEETISMHGIWSIKAALGYLQTCSDMKSAVALTDTSEAELRRIMRMVTDSLPESKMELLKLAKKLIPAFQEQIAVRTKKRMTAINSLKKCADYLAYTKIVKMNSCKYSDLTQFLADKESIEIFNHIADEMIIKTYAEEFYEFWYNLNVVNATTLDNVFVKKTDLTGIRVTLTNMCKEKRIFSSAALAKMYPVYTNTARIDEQIQKVHKYFLAVNFPKFCRAMCDIEIIDLSSEDVEYELEKLLQEHNSLFQKYANKTEAEVYLARDFSEDEILNCAMCDELVYGRYTLKRLENESIEQYCIRVEGWNGDCNGQEVYDNISFFRPFEKYWVTLSVCAGRQEAGFTSYGKAIFMDIVLHDLCYSNGNCEKIAYVLGASVMQQNIIKTVTEEVIGFKNPERDYRYTHGIYVTSIQNDMDKLLKWYDETVVKAAARATEINSHFDFEDSLLDVYSSIEKKVDDDGEAYNDAEDAIEEFAINLGITRDDVYTLMHITGHGGEL